MNRARQVIDVARTLVSDGLVVGTAGNVSARSGPHLLITPTRTRYDRLRRWHLAKVGLCNGHAHGRLRPSREVGLHLAIYRARGDVGAIVHTHSQYATAWSTLGRRLSPAIEERDYYKLGEVRTAAHRPAASPQLAAEVLRTLGQSRAVLLERHGVIAVGSDPQDALEAAEAVEHWAHVAWLTATLESRRLAFTRARSEPQDDSPQSSTAASA